MEARSVHTFILGSRQAAVPPTWNGYAVYILLINCHVLFELTEELALEVGFPSPFQTQTC